MFEDVVTPLAIAIKPYFISTACRSIFAKIALNLINHQDTKGLLKKSSREGRVWGVVFLVWFNFTVLSEKVCEFLGV